MSSKDYDDDIFTLQADEAAEHRKHVIQYALVSTFAVLVIALALYASYWLTQRRIAYQSEISTGQEAQAGDGQTEQDANYWPSQQFPDVPQLASNSYRTQINGDYAEVYVPQEAADGFSDYIEQLVDAGAQIFVQTQQLSVLNYGQTEIHIISNGVKNAVELCAESKFMWDGAGYEAFLLPASGRLARVDNGTGEASRVLTYRGASVNDALDYCAELAANDWVIVGGLRPDENIFLATYKKGDMQITVDYFSSGENYRVKLDFLTAQAVGE